MGGPIPPATAVAAQAAEQLTEGALAKAPAPISAEAPSVDALRQAVIAALADGGHASASQLLAGAKWELDVSSLRVEVAGLGKKMLSLTVNAAAEKIIRQELQRLGGPARFMVVPGEGAPASPRVEAPAPAGSVQEEALKNPMVQRAKEIFNAEVRSVVDLRTR
jgi:DNA polymerase-3 subunit gamma/tau